VRRLKGIRAAVMVRDYFLAGKRTAAKYVCEGPGCFRMEIYPINRRQEHAFQVRSQKAWKRLNRKLQRANNGMTMQERSDLAILLE
jgi:hypothetical protein